MTRLIEGSARIRRLAPLLAIGAVAAGLTLGGVFWLALPVLCCAGCSGLAARGWVRRQHPGQSAASTVSDDSRIVGVAKRNNGRVTAVLVAAETGLPLERAQSLLDSIARQGFASVQVSDEGKLWYEFPEFRREAQ